MQITLIIGIAASIFSAISSVPQLVKIIKEKKAKGISLTMVLVLLTGLGLWAYYGILLKDPVIIIANLFSFAVYTCILAFSLFYKDKKNALES